jgi:hypothetical protein
MPLDANLLANANKAEERMVEADHSAKLARADFHRAVRRLHLSGGSLREIADALGLSHQRVHQIVEDAGGGRRWRNRKDTDEVRACSFCSRPQRKSRLLVSGPGVFICDPCIGLAGSVLASGKKAHTPLGAISAVPAANTRERCSFCGKRRHQVDGIASTGAAEICSNCLKLCKEILAERLE